MKLTKIDIQGMHKVSQCRYLLDDVNYLVGPNGAGKSTVLQAIQLALLGYIPGFSKSSKSSIFKHCNGHALSVNLTIDDCGNTVNISRTWAGTINKCTSTLDVSPKTFDIGSAIAKLELPIFNFNDFLSLTSNKLKDWFIQFLPSSQSEIDWSETLVNCLDGTKLLDECLLPDTIKTIDSWNVSGLDQVRQANAYFKSQLSGTQSELKRLQNTIQSLYYYDDSELAELSLDDVQTRLAQIEKKILEGNKTNQSIYQRSKLEDNLKDYDHLQYSSLSDDPRYAELTSAISQLKQQSTDKYNEIAVMKAKLRDIDANLLPRQKMVSGGSVCPFTNSECASVANMINDIKSEIDQLTDERSNLSSEINKRNSEYNDICAQISIAQNEYKRIQDQYIERDALTMQLSQVSVEGDPVDIAELLAEQKQLNEYAAKLKANQQYSQLINKLSAEVAKVQQNVAILSKWVKITDANNLQTDIMKKPFEIIADKLTQCLNLILNDPSVEAQFYISSEANSFSFGINRDGRYLSFDLLSSGEKCLYTVALMSTIVSCCDSEIKVILIDDLIDHLDDTNAESMFDGLCKLSKECGIQFIAAGVKPCIPDDSRINIISV